MDITRIKKVKENLQKINSMMYLTIVAANTEDIGANESMLDSLDMINELLENQIEALEMIKE